MGKLIVTNRHWQEPYNEYGAYPSKLHNPYIFDYEKDVAIKKFNQMFMENIWANETNKLQEEIHALLERVKNYKGEYKIACVCKPKNCHLDIIANYVNNILRIQEEYA